MSLIDQIIAEKEADDEKQALISNLTTAPKEKESWYEDFGEGIGSSGINTFMGVKDLFTDLDSDDIALMKDWEEDAAESGWGTGGRVVGELAQMAVPGGAGLKAARALSAANKAKNVARALPLASEIAATAGHGALQYTEEPNGRLKNALTSGVAAGVGGAVGKVLQPVLGRSMMKLTDEAKSLIDRGVKLTPGQAAKSKAVQGVEAVMDVTPFLARGTKAAKARGMQDWSKETLKEVLPVGVRDRVNDIGQSGIRQVREAIDQGYDYAWGDVKNLTKAKIAKETMGGLTKKEKRIVNTVIEDISALPPGTSARRADEIIRQYRPTDPSQVRLRDAVKEIRTNLRKQLPKKQQEALARVDDSYRKYLAIQKAGSNAAEESALYTPNQLMQAVRSKGGDKLTSEGRAPMQDVATQGMKTVARSVGGQPLEWFRRIASISPTPLPMQAMGDTIMGQTAPQKYLAKLLRDKPEMMAPYITPARFGAAYNDEE